MRHMTSLLFAASLAGLTSATVVSAQSSVRAPVDSTVHSPVQIPVPLAIAPQVPIPRFLVGAMDPILFRLDDSEWRYRSSDLAARAADKAMQRIDVALHGLDLRFSNGLPDSPRAPWASADPADSLYRLARESLNSGDYRRAAQLFAAIERQYPTSAYRSDAAYWRAFALYRVGSIADLHEALHALDSVQITANAVAASAAAGTARMRLRSSQMSSALLATRIRGALAARGDATAAAQVARQVAEGGSASCDEEEGELRVEALNALVQLDPKSADPAIAKVLARRDECSAHLRRGAVALIGRSDNSRGTDLLISTARTDPAWEVRAEAVRWLGRAPDDHATAALSDIATSAGQRSPVQRTALRALAAQESPAARQALRNIINRADLPSDVRSAALHYAGRTGISVAELGKLYDSSADRQMREEVIHLLEQRPEPEAADKLIEIARIGTDPQMRGSAIAALSRRKDPRTAKLLTDILDK